jgi:hypothetical protein
MEPAVDGEACFASGDNFRDLKFTRHNITDEERSSHDIVENFQWIQLSLSNGKK